MDQLERVSAGLFVWKLLGVGVGGRGICFLQLSQRQKDDVTLAGCRGHVASDVQTVLGVVLGQIHGGLPEHTCAVRSCGEPGYPLGTVIGVFGHPARGQAVDPLSAECAGRQGGQSRRDATCGAVGDGHFGRFCHATMRQTALETLVFTFMSIALTVAFSLRSLCSTLFIVRQYQAAIPEQRPQIIWAAGGAVVILASGRGRTTQANTEAAASSAAQGFSFAEVQDAGVAIHQSGGGRLRVGGRVGEQPGGSREDGGRGDLISAEKFSQIGHANKASHKFGTSVDVYDPEDYADYHLWLRRTAEPPASCA